MTRETILFDNYYLKFVSITNQSQTINYIVTA